MHKRERARERERQITPMGKHTRLTFDAPMYMYMCVHIYKHICTCIHTYIHVYIYIHIHISTHTRGQTHTQTVMDGAHTDTQGAFICAT